MARCFASRLPETVARPPVLDLRVLGMGGRAGDLWSSAGLDPGDFQHRVVLGAMVPQELPEEEGEHLGEQQVGLGDPGLVLGDDRHPAGVCLQWRRALCDKGAQFFYQHPDTEYGSLTKDDGDKINKRKRSDMDNSTIT